MQKKTKKGIINIGTWNVRGTNEEGAVRNLVEIMEKYNIDILALQETKQKETGISTIKGYNFFNSGGEDRYLGVGFIVSKEVKESIIDFEAISNRVCKMRIQGKYRKITICNIHAPTEDKDVREKNEFYEEIGGIWERIPNYDLKILIGDMNAKIGREEEYKNVTGGKSKHLVSNENGKILIQFAEENNLKIRSTAYDHKDIYKETWISPDGRTKNQIDHIIVENKDHRDIKDVRSFRGADTNSDHILVRVKLKQEIPKKRNAEKSKITRYNAGKLLKEDIRKKLEEEIDKKMENKIQEVTVQKEWDLLEKVIQESLQQVGTKRNSKAKEWFTERCKIVLEERKQARLRFLNKPTEENKKKNEAARKKAKQVCRQEKRKYINEELNTIEEKYKNKEIRNFYQGAKKLREIGQKVPAYLKNKNGDLIGSTKEKLNRWVEYFDEVLNIGNYEEQTREQEEFHNNGQEVIEEPTDQEIEEECKKLKNNKSSGENGIPAEVLKYVGGSLKKRISTLIKRIWHEERMPQQWRNALICPIPKKGSKTNCENYRGISLLDVTYKVLARIIRNRLTPYHNNIVGEYQGGFKGGRSTIDQIFTLKMVQNQSYEQNLSLHIMFIDFMKAYDSIERRKLYEAMNKLSIPGKLIRLTRMTLTDTQNKVAAEGGISHSFRGRIGVRQGDPLSTVLFNIVLEAVIRDSEIQTQGIIYQRKQQIIAYADDVALMTRSKTELEKAFSKVEKAASLYGLKINEDKTKYLIMKQEAVNGQEYSRFVTDNKTYRIEKVNQFEYLGVTVTNKNEEDKEIEKRIIKGSKAMGTMKRMLKSKEVSRAAKVRIYRTVIRPTVVYGCEAWVLTKKNEMKLEVWERKMLRNIFGGTKTEEGLWMRKTNREVMELYGHSSIIKHVKAQRLRWLGHVSRMPEHRHSRRVLEEGEGGKKKRGRPKKKWLDAAIADIRVLGITDWKRAAQNRTQWRKIVKKVEEE